MSTCFTQEVLDFLTKHPWPGNVRELKNFCERVRVVSKGIRLDQNGIQHLFDQAIPLAVKTAFGDNDRIQSAMAQAGGKLTQAAKLLGIHRSTLWRWRQKARSEQAK